MKAYLGLCKIKSEDEKNLYMHRIYDQVTVASQDHLPTQCTGLPKDNDDQTAPRNYHIQSNVSNVVDDITCMCHNISPSQTCY